MITVSAFRWVPPFAQGLVRDLRVRWALEEASIPYREKLITFQDQSSAAYRALQPFGQVPAIETDDLQLFESGAIVLYIAERSEALMPKDASGRARVTAWIFAALNSVEPHVQNFAELDLFHAGEPWAAARRPSALEMVNKRLGVLEERLAQRDYLEEGFSAADIMMSTVLRNLRHTDVLAQLPRLKAYQQRCEGRAAFCKALSDHLAPFAAKPAA